MVYFFLSSANFATIFANLNSVAVLNGTNFKDYKENVVIVLDCMDLDLALRIEKPLLLQTLVLLKRRNFMRSGSPQIA